MAKCGRPAKYVTLDKFDKFVSNEFYHLKLKVNLNTWISLAILGAVIGTLVARFIW